MADTHAVLRDYIIDVAHAGFVVADMESAIADYLADTPIQIDAWCETQIDPHGAQFGPDQPACLAGEREGRLDHFRRAGKSRLDLTVFSRDRHIGSFDNDRRNQAGDRLVP